MWMPPNPVEAVQQTVRAFTSAGAPQRIVDPTAAQCSDTLEVPEHDFEPISERNVWSVCGVKVAGRMCARPKNHPAHRGPNTTAACGVCTAEQGSWMLCICDTVCDSKVCRHSNADQFDYRSIPVPRFQ